MKFYKVYRVFVSLLLSQFCKNGRTTFANKILRQKLWGIQRRNNISSKKVEDEDITVCHREVNKEEFHSPEIHLIVKPTTKMDANYILVYSRITDDALSLISK